MVVLEKGDVTMESAPRVGLQEGIWSRKFFTIWTGQAVSLLGSQLVQFGLIWYLAEQTDSGTVLAVASIIGLLPQVLFGPFIGTLVDRWDRRQVMLVADSIVALVTLGLAALFWTGLSSIGAIYVAMFIRGMAGMFHFSAMTASTSLMVPEEHLTRIQGLNQLLFGGLNIISAPLGAILLSVIAVQGILMIDVFTGLFAILPLLFLSIPRPERISVPQEAQSAVASVWRDFREGLLYVRGWPGLVVLFLMAMLVNILLRPTFSLYPLLVTRHFGGGALQLGWLNAALGIGIVVGGLVLGAWGGFKRRIFSIIMGVFGLAASVLLLSLTPSGLFPLALFAVLVTGASIAFTDGPLHAILQATVEPSMQGRVFTLVFSLSGGMAPIGLAIAGPLSDVYGVRTIYLGAGMLCLAAGVAAFFIPALLNFETSQGRPS
jgi:DHA3 family macrolide efflux protein-like MFS transporter